MLDPHSAVPGQSQHNSSQPHSDHADMATDAHSSGIMMANPMPRRHFSSGLCGCCSDCSTCCYGMFCLSCLYGDNVSKMAGGGCVGPCCLYYWCSTFACCFAGSNRASLRARHNLAEEPCSDCCVHCWCSPCAVCQEARELKTDSGPVPAQVVMVAPPALQTMPSGAQSTSAQVDKAA